MSYFHALLTLDGVSRLRVRIFATKLLFSVLFTVALAVLRFA